MVDETTPYYRARVAIGPDPADPGSAGGPRLVWNIERGDPAAYGPLDGLTIGWKLPDNAAYPSQPELPYANFRVIVADAADFAGVDVGAPVSIHVWDQPAGFVLPAGWSDGSGSGLTVPVATFGGRITDLKAEPHALGMIYTVSALDYLVDLSDTQVAADDDTGWPGESLENRLTRLYELADDDGTLFAAAPWGDGYGPEPGWGVLWGNANPPLAPVLDHMTNALAQYVHYGHYDPPIQGGARGVLLANTLLDGIYGAVDNRPDPARRYDTRWLYKRLGGNPNQGGYPLPAQLRQDPATGKWRPVVDPDSAHSWVGDPNANLLGDLPTADRFGSLPARYVDFDPTSWSRTKKEQAEKVRVQTTTNWASGPARTWVQQTTYNAYGRGVQTRPPKVLTVDTELGYADEARTLARWLIPDPAESSGGKRWEVDTFRLRADQLRGRITAANRRSWFTLSSILSWPLVAIGGLDPTRTPDGRDYYVGLITGATFTIKDGRYWIDFQLSRQIPNPVSGAAVYADQGQLSVKSMKAVAAQAAVKLNQLDPTFSVYDYRVVRGG